MNKTILFSLSLLLASSLYAVSGACCSSQGGCKNNKSCQTQNDQKIIAEMMNLKLNAMQRDKFRAMLMKHKMERKKTLNQLKEKMYGVLTPAQKKELQNRVQNNKTLKACK